MSAQQTRQRDPYAPIARRFKNETAKHEMTILLDQGLHRHLHFAATSGSAYWFDLITVPGALIFQGDGESFVFRRVRDMFEFFRSNPDRATHRISPHYWAEKLTSSRDAVKGYSREALDKLAAEHLADAEEQWPGVTEAWEAETADSLDYDLDYEETARRALDGFEYGAKMRVECSCGARLEIDADAHVPMNWHRTHWGTDHVRTSRRTDGFRFRDTWEWDLKDYDWWYLWACHAIVWGIARYDTARKFAAIDAAPAAAPIVVEVVPRVPAVVNVVPVGGVL